MNQSYSHPFIHTLLDIPPPVFNMNNFSPPWTFQSSTKSAPVFGIGSGTAPAGSQPHQSQAVPKRNKWCKLSDPSLELNYGSKERALDLSLGLYKNIVEPKLSRLHRIGGGVSQKSPCEPLFRRSEALEKAMSKYANPPAFQW